MYHDKMTASAADLSISVVIPAYNEEQAIGACLDSVISQIRPGDEIIVIDNNSTDRTAQIAKRYPVRVVPELLQGFTPARNRGFTEASNEIVARVDADGLMVPGYLDAVRAVFSEDPHLLGATGPVYFHDLPVRLRFPFPGNSLYMRLVGCWPALLGPSMVITKTAWNQVKDEIHCNDREVHEDMDLTYHIQKYGKIAFDKRLKATTSSRRMVHQPKSYFWDYSLQNFRTVLIHQGPRWSRRRKSV